MSYVVYTNEKIYISNDNDATKAFTERLCDHICQIHKCDLYVNDMNIVADGNMIKIKDKFISKYNCKKISDTILSAKKIYIGASFSAMLYNNTYVGGGFFKSLIDEFSDRIIGLVRYKCIETYGADIIDLAVLDYDYDGFREVKHEDIFGILDTEIFSTPAFLIAAGMEKDGVCTPVNEVVETAVRDFLVKYVGNIRDGMKYEPVKAECGLIATDEYISLTANMLVPFVEDLKALFALAEKEHVPLSVNSVFTSKTIPLRAFEIDGEENQVIFTYYALN